MDAGYVLLKVPGGIAVKQPDMNIFVALLVWVVLSIPTALVLGQILARSARRTNALVHLSARGTAGSG